MLTEASRYDLEQSEEWEIGAMAWGKGRTQPERPPMEEAALYEYAVKSLGRKMRSVAELKRLMRRHVEADAAGEAKMQAVVARLKEQGYLNDTRYAADYTRMRQENERFGRRRVQQELVQRGVHGEVIQKTLEDAYADVPEPELARRYIARKRLRPPTNDKETARVMRSLARAGFSPGTIFGVLKSWQVHDAALEAVESLEEGPDGAPEAE